MTRSMFRSLQTAAVTSGLTVGICGVGLAQDTTVHAPAVTDSAPAAPTELPSAPPPVTTVAPSPVVVAPAPEGTTEPGAVAEAPAPKESETHWYDDLSVGAFVDAYAAIRSDSNAGRNAAGATVANPAGYGHEAYVQASGFGLAFAGADLAYSGEKFGATVSMRFGPGVNRFYAADQGAFGIDNITQGFVTWKPTDKLTLDLGQFYTIYGAEVTESWRNVNYSRGALYYSMQPFWHTGLRANYKLNDVLAVNTMVVNGVNTAFEGNKSPSLGVQVLLTPIESLTVAVGYLGGLHPRNGDDETAPTKNFQDFFDVVATVTSGSFKLVLNADYNRYKAKFAPATDEAAASGGTNEYWWGVSAAPAVSITDWFGVGARVEYLEDSANSQLLQAGATGKAKLTTLTATLDFKPVPNSTALILRPEFRYELAGDKAFNDGKVGSGNGATDKFWSLHLGAVVTSMP